MPATARSWEQRLDWTLTALLWGSYGLGVFMSILLTGVEPRTTISAAVAGAYVVSVQAMPLRFRHHQNIGELTAVLGVVVALFTVAITGGVDSPYLLFLATPSFYAGAFLGFRIGIETALLSSTGLVVVAATLGQETLQGQVVQTALLYLLMAVAVAQTRRVLVEAHERSAALVAASELTAAKLARLEAAHSALVSLSELASAAELNPVNVGEAALRDLALIVPFSAGQVVLNDERGTVVVARRGEPGTIDRRTAYPMQLADRLFGHLALWPHPGGNLDGYRPVILELLRPVILAFDNILLLRSIARRAVQEERTRLARELHDEIGPALASLGLGVDMGIMMPGATPEVARQLESVRRSITTLAEDVRSTVADLRHESTDSIIEQANRLVAEAGADGPAVIVDIDERRTPRAELASEVAAIMTEAVRNAFEHAGAKSIRIEGKVDRDQGSLIITDDGRGFDPEDRPPGHYGLIGMRERAAKFKGSVVIDSQLGGGTKVTVEWGE
jgi:signal transduction histidine kinase